MPRPEPVEANDYAQDQRERRQDRRDDKHSADVDIAANKVRIEGLERWQVAQNGSLRRMEEKLDALQVSSSERFEKLQTWMMGSMFTALLAIVGIVATHFWK